VVWGPGRHTNAGTFFVYFLDPDGLTLEYGYGMEEFPETGARAPNIRPPGMESVDLWDSHIDPRTCASGEVERAAL
jgi:2,3-dihydroxy-p-cumate/2,3-dihydroxybenzoate 3,4-dioxygenase